MHHCLDATAKENRMKRLILLAAIGAMAATPALARSHHHKSHHHYARNYAAPGGAYGYYRGATSPCVYVNGRYAGCDPDPNVRRSLVDEYYFLHHPFY
jgi:hypothetical protein